MGVEQLCSVQTLHTVAGNKIMGLRKPVNNNYNVLYRDSFTGTAFR